MTTGKQGVYIDFFVLTVFNGLGSQSCGWLVGDETNGAYFSDLVWGAENSFRRSCDGGDKLFRSGDFYLVLSLGSVGINWVIALCRIRKKNYSMKRKCSTFFFQFFWSAEQNTAPRHGNRGLIHTTIPYSISKNLHKYARYTEIQLQSTKSVFS